ncbi:CBS domain-containing protein [Candidatus Bathyarchaeota archaeon]|nr:MAG: CBS domain-containing protein [Candidatus Bathyarchaeota archaeon]RJS82430.1 MAG: CBS domain-containing protein [Candidatus Bathyarchaeota archaeon]
MLLCRLQSLKKSLKKRKFLLVKMLKPIYIGVRKNRRSVSLLSSDEKEEGSLSLKVEDVMIKEVITIDENASVKEAAEVMNKFEIGCLIAIREGKAIGIITERDLLKRVVAEARDTTKTKVKDVMSSPLVVVEPNMNLEEAVKLMFQMKIKKLPVVEGKRLVGLVSLTDIARFQPQMIKILKQLAMRQAAPKSMKKVIDYYVV